MLLQRACDDVLAFGVTESCVALVKDTCAWLGNEDPDLNLAYSEREAFNLKLTYLPRYMI